MANALGKFRWHNL